jgi:hypothetical protein
VQEFVKSEGALVLMVTIGVPLTIQYIDCIPKSSVPEPVAVPVTEFHPSVLVVPVHHPVTGEALPPGAAWFICVTPPPLIPGRIIVPPLRTVDRLTVTGT